MREKFVVGNVHCIANQSVSKRKYIEKEKGIYTENNMYDTETGKGRGHWDGERETRDMVAGYMH